MAKRTAEMERVSDVVSERLGELLGARVCVLDERGALIASSEPIRGEPTVAVAGRLSTGESVCVPIDLGVEIAQVVIQPTTGETVSPRLAQNLVGWLVAQATAVTRLSNQHALKD